MEFDEPGWQLIDDFVLQLAVGRNPETVRRYGRVRDRLTYFLDTADMSFDLGVGPATLLDAEREFHEHGAFWLIYGPGELVECLPGFISRPWLPDSAAAARVQISVVARLAESLRDESTVSPTSIAGMKLAVTYARHQVERRSASADPDPRATDIPQRLLRKPATEW